MANVVDGTRARVHQRAAEEANPEEGDVIADPEVVLLNNVDGDNPPVIPEMEEGEAREDYAFRVMQAWIRMKLERVKTVQDTPLPQR